MNADVGLQKVMGGFIHAARTRRAVGLGTAEWKEGTPLELLLACYVGTRNTGADVRVEEMIRQFRHLLGDENIRMSILTLDPKLSQGYFKTVRQRRLPQVFPRYLYREVRKHHGVVACEGSMFKSKFANALTTMMGGALGLAAAEGKLAVGYGAEAGHMDPSMEGFVRKHCKDAFVICRNEPSRGVLDRLGIRSAPGTDTAWTFEPAPLERGRTILCNAGWDGSTPILAICPINPFWWPVKPSLKKTLAFHTSGKFRDQHYKSIYFHEWSAKSASQYHAYLEAIAGAFESFHREGAVFPILVGMEQLDRRACEDLARHFRTPPPLFISDTIDMYDLVSILRNATYMLSSRFHAIVTSMPGLVASAGITMDERIQNVMAERGHPHLFLRVDDDHLMEGTLEMLRTLRREREGIQKDIAQMIPRELEKMGKMGMEFLSEVSRVYPGFPKRDLGTTWHAYLPRLSSDLRMLLERHS